VLVRSPQSAMTRSIHNSYILATHALLASAAGVDDASAMQAGERRRQAQRRQTGQARPPARQRQTQRPSAARARADSTRAPQPAVGSSQPASDTSRFVEHAAYIRAGHPGPDPFALRLVSPLASDQQVVTTGSQLYLSYNCLDCRRLSRYGRVGRDGPEPRRRALALRGRPERGVQVDLSRASGGHAVVGSRISDADIWRLVAYVRSLEVWKNVATENFTGKAQQRMGH
jgi:hypothetical protein